MRVNSLGPEATGAGWGLAAGWGTKAGYAGAAGGAGGAVVTDSLIDKEAKVWVQTPGSAARGGGVGGGALLGGGCFDGSSSI
jgi:hypothetical protein